MGHRPESTMFFGVELVDFHDWENDNESEDMPYDYGWEERIAAKLNIVQGDDENSIDFHARVAEEVGVMPIEAGDDNHDTFTIGIVSTVVHTDWDQLESIEPGHPIFRYATKGEGVGGDAEYWCGQMQKFCDNMLNLTVDIKALYREGKVGWRLAAYYPSD
jgi:hypothetical protein